MYGSGPPLQLGRSPAGRRKYPFENVVEEKGGWGDEPPASFYFVEYPIDRIVTLISPSGFNIG
jgi:hypothetical protein